MPSVDQMGLSINRPEAWPRAGTGLSIDRTIFQRPTRESDLSNLGAFDRPNPLSIDQSVSWIKSLFFRSI